MSRNPKSLLLVFIQALMLIYLFLSSPVLPSSLLPGIFLVAGISLALWATWCMRITTIQITADVAPDSNLVTDGPYEFIRHPMYVAVLLVGVGLLLNYFSSLRLFALTLLLIDFIIKADYEESLLGKFFSKGYADYQKKTKKFIPFIY